MQPRSARSEEQLHSGGTHAALQLLEDGRFTPDRLAAQQAKRLLEAQQVCQVPKLAKVKVMQSCTQC